MILKIDKKRKNILLGALSTLCVSALAFGFALSGTQTVAKAATVYDVDNFTMATGAATRTDDSRGLRFTTRLTKSEYDSLIAEGHEDKDIVVTTLITPTRYLSDDGVTYADGITDFTRNVFDGVEGKSVKVYDFTTTTKVENYGQAVLVEKCENAATPANCRVLGCAHLAEDTYEYRAVIYNILEKNISRDFSARSYITVDGANLGYTEFSFENNSRSIFEVAEKAIADPNRGFDENSDEYKNVSALAKTYTVTVKSPVSDEETTITLPRGACLSWSKYSSQLPALADVAGVFYPNGEYSTNVEDYTFDTSIAQDVTLMQTGNSLTYTENVDGTFTVSGVGNLLEKTTSIVIPATWKGKAVTAIADSVFENNTTIKTLLIGKNVTSIGANAFKGCTALEKVTFPVGKESALTLGTSIFEGCTSLQTAQLTNISSVSSRMFYNCNALQTLTVNVEPLDFACAQNDNGYAILLANKGVSNYKIVISENASKTEKHAAEELQYFMQQATDCFLPIITDEGLVHDNSTVYATILEKIDEIAVDAEGVVLLDKTQRLPQSHRHFSHTMGLYPLHLINYDIDENKRIYDNTLLHLEQLGTGWWVGFSFAMSAQLYAMAQNGNAAYEKLRTFCKGFVADNGFHLNGDFKNYGFSQWHYRPFTLESLFGYCDALQEMLLQDHQGYLDIFPAVPQEWLQKVSFKKLRSYGGVLVSAKALKGQVEWVELVLPCDMKLKVKNVFNTQTLNYTQNKETKVLTDKDGYFTLQGKKGKIILKRIKA